MAGLALAVGMLVDNSIVVLESIFRQREEGENIQDSAIHGASSVAMAITASTLTTLAVFTPVLFVPGIAGELFKDMVLTIVISLSVSLIVALTLVPLLASRFLRIRKRKNSLNSPAASENKQAILQKWSERIGSVILQWQDFYTKNLDWALKHRKIVIFSALGLFILSIIILANLGGDFIPKNDMGFISIAVDRSSGTSLEEMKKSMHQLNAIITENAPEVENVYANFGQGEGIMAMFSTRGASEGDLTIRLKKLSERKRSMFEIQDALQKKFKDLPDVDARFEDRGNTALMGAGADIMIEIFGHDLQVAEALAAGIEERIKNIEGIASIKSSIKQSAPELMVNLDRQRIADLGLSTAQIGQVLSTSILGTVATQFRTGGDEYDIRVHRWENRSRCARSPMSNTAVPRRRSCAKIRSVWSPWPSTSPAAI